MAVGELVWLGFDSESKLGFDSESKRGPGGANLTVAPAAPQYRYPGLARRLEAKTRRQGSKPRLGAIRDHVWTIARAICRMEIQSNSSLQLSGVFGLETLKDL